MGRVVWTDPAIDDLQGIMDEWHLNFRKSLRQNDEAMLAMQCHHHISKSGNFT